MSLSDRLQRARTQQLIDAGLLTQAEADDEAMVADVADHSADEVADEVADDSAVVEEPAEGLFAPITIEAQPVGLHLVAETRRDLNELPDDESSLTCPTCNTRGHVDMVDLVGHTVHYTCPSCSTMWQVRKTSVNESVLPTP